ncbi:hypothetical protein H9P43_010188, partial [Blastocladiella emersonii ATCC 22665]
MASAFGGTGTGTSGLSSGSSSTSAGGGSNARFRVRLHSVRALNLPARDSNGTSDPQFRFSFDNFKTGKSEVVKRDLNPAWDFDVTFFYETRYVEHLRDKRFRIEVYDHDRWRRDEFIGACEVDLLTLARGPIKHELPLRDHAKHPAGKILFDLDMDLWNDITCTFEALLLRVAGNHIHEPYLEISPATAAGSGSGGAANEAAGDSGSSSIAAAAAAAAAAAKVTTPPATQAGPTASWNTAPLLVFNTSYRDYREGALQIEVHSQRLGARVGHGQLRVRDLPATGGSLFQFRVPIQNHAGQVIGTLEGRLGIRNAPSFGQMAAGVHTEMGVLTEVPDASGGFPVVSHLTGAVPAQHVSPGGIGGVSVGFGAGGSAGSGGAPPPPLPPPKGELVAPGGGPFANSNPHRYSVVSVASVSSSSHTSATATTTAAHYG